MQRVSKESGGNSRLSLVLRRIGNVLLVISLLVFPLFLSSLIASGWLMHADHYGAPFQSFGIWMLICEGLLTVAVILYFCKLDLAAAVLGSGAYLPMLYITMRAVELAQEQGWTGQTAANFGQNASAVWRDGLLGIAIPVMLLLILAITRYLSYESVVRRKQRKEAKLHAEQQKAPGILGEETE